MANTINDLYLKYVNKVGSSLEKDRYFQYLFAMTQAGQNTLQQSHKVLHKEVDELWLSTIEDCLGSLTQITENPRRFVATTEEIVPVSLAKKITAESVRHLSQNTQFIAADEDGEIHPSRILNVTTEDSIDLYENRFIYYLIDRLVAFIDKRTDLIFWSTGDETLDTLVMESSIDDAYETIDYRLELRIHNQQSLAENDSQQMQVFMRIDRVRRMVMALRNSAFCSLLAGCAKVRSPIQRTNLLTKNPDYRKCYQLWQFLEKYDSIGYSIEEQDWPLSFDEEYVIQLQSGLITNYAVFKSIMESDLRNLDEVPPKRRRVTKPKFLKRIEEQLVDNCDLEDVEIRRVFIEEVTQAQLDAQAEAERQKELAQEAYRLRDAAESREAEAMDRLQEALLAQETAGQKAAEERQSREVAESALARAVRAHREKLEAAEKARIEAQRATEQSEAVREALQAQLEQEQAARAEAEALHQAAEAAHSAAEAALRQTQDAVQQAQAAIQQAEEAQRSAEARLLQAQTAAETERQALQAAADDQLRSAREAAEEQLRSAQAAAEERLRSAQEAADEQLRSAQVAAEAQRRETEALADARVQAAEEHRRQSEQARRIAEQQTQELRQRCEALERAAEQSAAACSDAEQQNREAQAELRSVRRDRDAAELRSREAAELRRQAMEAVRNAVRDREAALRSSQTLEEQLQAAQNAQKQLQAALEAEQTARLSAERRAEALTLGKRIRSAMGGKRQ